MIMNRLWKVTSLIYSSYNKPVYLIANSYRDAVNRYEIYAKQYKRQYAINSVNTKVELVHDRSNFAYA